MASPFDPALRLAGGFLTATLGRADRFVRVVVKEGDVVADRIESLLGEALVASERSGAALAGRLSEELGHLSCRLTPDPSPLADEDGPVDPDAAPPRSSPAAPRGWTRS